MQPVFANQQTLAEPEPSTTSPADDLPQSVQSSRVANTQTMDIFL